MKFLGYDKEHSSVYLECIRLFAEAYVAYTKDINCTAVDGFMMAVVLHLQQWHVRRT